MSIIGLSLLKGDNDDEDDFKELFDKLDERDLPEIDRIATELFLKEDGTSNIDMIVDFCSRSPAIEVFPPVYLIDDGSWSTGIIVYHGEEYPYG